MIETLTTMFFFAALVAFIGEVSGFVHHYVAIAIMLTLMGLVFIREKLTLGIFMFIVAAYALFVGLTRHAAKAN